MSQKSKPYLDGGIVSDFKINDRCFPVFSCFGLHYHEYYEILLHLKNGRKLFIDQQAIEMQPYDLYLIPPFQIHGMVGQGNLTDYERIYIYITEQMLERLGQGVLSITSILNDCAAKGKYRFSILPEDYSYIKSLDKEYFQHASNPYHMLESYSHLSLLFVKLCRRIQQQAPAPVSQAYSPLIYEVYRFLNEHYTEKIGLDELALLFNCSKYYLSHEFSRIFNTSIYRYILIRRVALAQKMILQDKPFAVAAEQCGFNDYSNFLRAFTSITTETPSSYRNRIENTMQLIYSAPQ